MAKISLAVKELAKNKMLIQADQLRLKLQEAGFNYSIRALALVIEHHKGMRRDNVTHEAVHLLDVGIAAFHISNMYLSNDKELSDELIASALLHDLWEDYPELYSLEQLYNDFPIKTFFAVKAVSKDWDFEKTHECRVAYYEKVAETLLSVVVKGLDRVNNLMSMEGVFTDAKCVLYVEETDQYIIPMIEKAMIEYPLHKELLSHVVRELTRQCDYTITRLAK